MSIPKIIHQVWEGKSEPLPKHLLVLSETWKTFNPQWEYWLWSYDLMEELVFQQFPDFLDTYHNFPKGVQRWDAIRYMILYTYGGLYVDLDYECIEPIEKILNNKICCFGMEPPEHSANFQVDHLIGNAFMAAKPYQPFFKHIIEELKKFVYINYNVNNYVVQSTGPLMLNRVYNSYLQKNEIDLINYELVTPISKREVLLILNGKETSEIVDKIEKAYAIHYFFGSWY